MMIQMHNEKSNAIGLDRDLELIWKWLRGIQKKEMEKMTKRSWKIKYFRLHDHVKISHDYAKWTRRNFCCKVRNAPRRRNLLLLHFWFRTIMQNCWISCEITILLLNFRYLSEEASGRSLRWCQVSTWPWPINRNLIFSFKNFLDISNYRIFQISSL